MKKCLAIILSIIVIMSLVCSASADIIDDLFYSNPWGKSKAEVEKEESTTQKKESKAGKQAVVVTYKVKEYKLEKQYYFVEDKLVAAVFSVPFGSGREQEQRLMIAIRNFDDSFGTGSVDIDKKLIAAQVNHCFDRYSIPHDKKISNYKKTNGLWQNATTIAVLVMDGKGNVKEYFFPAQDP